MKPRLAGLVGVGVVAAVGAAVVLWPGSEPAETPGVVQTKARPAPKRVSDSVAPVDAEERMRLYEENQRKFDALAAEWAWDPDSGALYTDAEFAACVEYASAQERLRVERGYVPSYAFDAEAWCRRGYTYNPHRRAATVCGVTEPDAVDAAALDCVDREMERAVGTPTHGIWIDVALRDAMNRGDYERWEQIAGDNDVLKSYSLVSELNQQWGSTLASVAPTYQRGMLRVAEEMSSGMMRDAAFAIAGSRACRRADRGDFWCVR